MDSLSVEYPSNYYSFSQPILPYATIIAGKCLVKRNCTLALNFCQAKLNIAKYITSVKCIRKMRDMPAGTALLPSF